MSAVEILEDLVRMQTAKQSSKAIPLDQSGVISDSDLDAITVAKRFEDDGVGALIITDIDRDGALLGFNVEAFGAIADAVNIPVIAAGGLATVDDIVRLKARKGAKIAGAVLGRALYNGDIVPVEALKVAA